MEKVFRGLHIAASGTFQKKLRHKTIQGRVTKLGGRFVTVVDDKTHVVIAAHESIKHQKDQEAGKKGVPRVRIAWLEDCMTESKCY
jgi:NAD-dependent DNA ligase